MAIKGKIIYIGHTESGTSRAGKPWRKQLFVLDTEGQYPKKVAFYVMNDNIEKSAIQMGQTVEVEIDIESREYQGKWYTNNGTAWKVTNLGFIQGYQQPQPVYQQQAPQGYSAPQPQQQTPFPTTGNVAF